MSVSAPRSPVRRSLALGLSLAMALPAGWVLAPTTAYAAPVQDKALAESRTLYEEGKVRFDTFDYNSAVDLWTKAYAKIPVDPTTAGVRNAMVYNIATAQEKAYDVDKDLQHLRQAVLLLESYVKNYKVLYQRTPETAAEVGKAEDRIAAIKERIARAERGEEPTPAPVPVGTPEATPTEGVPTDARFGSGEVDGIQWNTGHSPPVDQDLLAKNRLLASEERKTDNMLIGSYVALSVGGVIAIGGAGALLGANAIEATEDEPGAGQSARNAGYGTLAFGLAGLVTGVTLLVIGLQRRQKAKAGTLVSATPVVGPKFAGASLRLRF